ncbi:MAG: hypothetical protein KF857_08705 [Fimbriimonadaceae bacterium]|nr:hypothetical protein [Fimbriimonadaceae bacterium]
MGRTLLVGDCRWSWRDWARENAAGRDLLVLDPSVADHGPATRLLLVRAGKVAAWAHIGSPDPFRDPVALLAGAARLLGQADADAVVQMFPWRSSPLGRHLALNLATMVAPSRVLVPEGSGLAHQPWPVGAEGVDLPEAFPPVVQEAQRRAQWLDLIERAEKHSVDLDQVVVVGSRLGSGEVVDADPYTEVCGGAALVVTNDPMGDAEVGRVMDSVQADRSVIVSPDRYAGLVCSLARQDGSDFGLGLVSSLDLVRRVVHVRALAVAPAPVRILKVGTLRVDSLGKEIEDLKPWAV